MLKANIKITLKETIFDPSGKAVKDSLNHIGFENTEDVRIGRYIQIKLNTDDEEYAKKEVEEMCDKLLVNSIIEKFEYEIEKL